MHAVGIDLRESWFIDTVEVPTRLVLAPMAGVSVQAFRRQGRRFGAGLVCSEMVSCAGIEHRNEKTLGYLRVASDERLVELVRGGSEAAFEAIYDRHHRGIEHLVTKGEMAAKIEAAVAARQDSNMLVIARTGAVRHEGIDAACERARAYVEAGADVLLPLPASADDIARLRAVVDVPLATIGMFDQSIHAHPAGIGLFIDPITPHVAIFQATKQLFERHGRGEGSGIDPKELMALYRELGTTGGFDELYDIERATTEKGT